MSVECERPHRQVPGGAVSFALLVIAMLAATVHAQVTTGTIVGTVTDTSGGVLPGATVTVTNTNTALTRTVPTGSDGAFLVSALPPGPYRVEVTLEGFIPFTHEGFRLEVGQNARVDARLAPEGVAEEVAVAATAPRVDTRSSSVRMVVDAERMEELPLLNRSTLSLAQLAPGISSITLPQAVTNQRSGPSIAAGTGGRATQNNVQLDGAQVTSALYNRAQNLPSPDSIQEFQVLTNSYSAEYGRAAGASLLAITKSGTNNVRGGVWEYFRNDALNATNFFAPSKPVLRQNQFGGNLGGPLIRDRTFFFGNYEGMRLREEAQLRFFPPTAAERAGDFSTRSRPVIDPVTGQPFPDNRIPADRLDPMALNVLEAYVPLPNQGAEFNTLAPSPTDGDQGTVRIDHRLTDPNTVSVRWHRNETVGLTSGDIQDLWVDRGNLIDSWTISNTHIFGSRLVGEGRVSFTTIETEGPAAAMNQTPRQLGALFDQDGAVPIAPNMTVSGAFTMSQVSPWLERSRLYDFTYKMSWLTGRHNIQVGFGLLRQSQRLQTQFLSAGSFDFTGAFTGDPVADFLIGRPASFTQQAVLDNLQRSQTWSAFIQDDVRLGRLTVNLGARFERFEPWEEESGRVVTFRPDQQSTRFPDAPRGLVFPGDAGVVDGLVPPSRDVNPRLGLAWDVRGDGRTAVRAGYGRFTAVEAAITTAHGNEAPPFVPVVAFAPDSLRDPFGDGHGLFPLAEGEALFPVPMQIFSVDPDWRPGHVHQFNVTFQQQLTKDLVVQAGYVGSRGRDLTAIREINAAVFGSGATLANAQQRRPHAPESFAGIAETVADSRADYDSLQISATKRYSDGYTFQVAYTLSKSMDDGSVPEAAAFAQNPADPDAEWAPSDVDRRHVLRVNGMWELPSMRERPAGVRHVLGGWRLAGIVSVLSGTPYTVTSGADVALVGPSRGLADQRPHLVADPALDTGRSRDDRIARYFDTAAFTRPAPGEFGNAPRNLLTGPGSFTTDASITKQFRPWSSAPDRRIELRVEVFNLFNTVNLGNPVTNMNSPAFGQIQTAAAARVIQLGLRFDF